MTQAPASTLDGADETLSPAALARIAAAIGEDDSSPTPKQIGRYRLAEPIGRGGMGEVWRAEQQQPLRRTVALKLIKLGMDTREVIARFGAERQALALMNHPNVAKVLDAGTSDAGRPYFVMEYVPGEPITAFCDRHHYSITQRLELFTQTCAAVEHAHQKGVLHRDLKPGNILVTEESGQPQVKVIDFGVAKALQSSLGEQSLQTVAGQLVGTPEYMSPEQAISDGRDVDTRSDIYSLGVVLYELLSGVLPFDSKTLRGSGVAGIQKMIREVDPPRPSTRLSGLSAADAASIAQRRQTAIGELRRQLRSELEWIPLKAMRKQREQRYASPAALAGDLDNYLSSKPLLAGPESRRYRIGKFVRRNRRGVAVVVAFALLLVGGAALYVHGIRTEQAKTERALSDARQVADFQGQMLAGINVHQMGESLHDAFVQEAAENWSRSKLSEAEVSKRRAELESLLEGANFTNTAVRNLNDNLIHRALQTIDEKFADQPKVKARLLQNLASTLVNFTVLKDATGPQTQALEIRRSELGENDPETLESMSEMARLLRAQAHWPQAEAFSRQVLERLRRRKLEEDDRLMLSTKADLAEAIQRQGPTRYAEAQRYRAEVLDGCRRALDKNDPATLEAMYRLGMVLLWQKRLEDAEPYLVGAVDGMRAHLRADSEVRLNACGTLGRLRFFQEQYPESESLYRESYEGLRALLGDNARDTLFAAQKLGSTLSASGNSGKYLEAELYLQRALAGQQKCLPENHPDTFLTYEELGILRQRQHKLPEAESYLSTAVDGFRLESGSDNENTLWSLWYLGWAYDADGKSSDAEKCFEEIYRRSQHAPLAASDAATLASGYGPFLVRQSRYPEAEAPLRDAYRRLIEIQPDRLPRLLQVVFGLAEVCDHTNRPEEAAKWRAELARLRASTQPTTAPN